MDWSDLVDRGCDRGGAEVGGPQFGSLSLADAGIETLQNRTSHGPVLFEVQAVGANYFFAAAYRFETSAQFTMFQNEAM